MTLPESLARASVPGPTAVALGTFDGVHRGHRRLIAELADQARQLGGRSVVVTFHPRPMEVLRPGASSRYLCDLERRVELLRAAGADVVISVEFNLSLARTSADEFAQALVEHLGMRRLVGGPDLAIGREREGTPEVLARIGERLGFEVVVVPAAEVGNAVVHSSVIQRLLDEGDVGHAATMLGRPHSVRGTVVHGAGRGKQLGIPTANVAVGERILLPATGIYAVRFRVGGKELKGAASLGTNPTFGENARTLEVYVLDFADNLYGATCEVEFVSYLRPEARFESIDALLRQIREDIRVTREILG